MKLINSSFINFFICYSQLVKTYVVCLNYTNIKKEFFVFCEMSVCSKCGEDKAKLFDIVSEEGIVNICIDCLQDDKVPVVKKPLDSAFEDSNNKKSVYERLSSVAGINPDEHTASLRSQHENLSSNKNILGGMRFEERIEKKEEQNNELKEIVNSRFKDNLVKSVDTSNDLIRNFHWVIMRARRLRKITLSELAKKIAEPEEILKMVENGIVPEGNLKLLRKLETYFGIQVLTSEARKKIDSFEKKIGFDPVTTRILTIDDLLEMKKKKEKAIFENSD